MVTPARHGSPGGTNEESEASFIHQLTRTLVSVELLTEMRLPRARRSSRRVILKASITSVILLSIAFIITYSVMLSYISSKAEMMRHHDGSHPEKSKSGKRTKLLPRPFEVFGRQEHVFKVTEKTEAVVKWNIESFEDLFTSKPECAIGGEFVVLITSSPQNYNRRKALRETWCNPSNLKLPANSWQCVFLIGQTTHTPSQVIVENEINTHRDILLGSYADTYRNLTLKVIHGLSWASRTCSAKYVLKTDDDVFVNTKVLYKIITQYRAPARNVYIGMVYHDPARLVVIRNPHSQWAVSYDIYPETHYPPYAVGMGYLLSEDVVKRMVNESKYVPPIPNEDAYIGVLADRIKVEPYSSGRFTLSGSGLSLCNYVYVVVVHYIEPSLQVKMMNRSVLAETQCSWEKDNYLNWH